MSVQSPKLQLEKHELLDQTPTEKVMNVERNLLEKVITDADGRVYKLRLPDPIDELDLSAALGREYSANIGVLVMATPLIFIESIDGAPFNKPNNYPEVRAAVKRLGRHGMDALQKAVQKYQIESQASQEDISNIKK